MAVQTQIQVRRGTAASWTSTNPTLAAGELGFETDTGKFKIGTGSAVWTSLNYAGGGQNTLTTYQYTATSGQTTFSGADANGNTLSYTAGNIQVYLNGTLLAGSEYTASNGTSVVLGTGAVTGDSFTVIAIGSFTVSSDITKATLSAKGSLITASAAATPANLSVGSNDQVLTADSSTATGLKWASPSSADDFALINAGGTALTGATTITVNVSGKNALFVRIDGASASANSIMYLRLNADNAANYGYSSLYLLDQTSTRVMWVDYSRTAASFPVSRLGNDTVAAFQGDILIQGTNATGIKPIHLNTCSYGDNTNDRSYTLTGAYRGTSAITSVSLISGTGNFDAGTIYVYGA